MSQPFLGQITLFGFNYAPYGWQQCAGQTLPISQNAALFALLGTAYGGNGTSTFQLPNLQGTVPVSQGTSTTGTPYDMGEQGGAETVTLTINTMPSHSHTLNADTGRAQENTLANNLLPAKGDANGGAVNLYAPPSAGAQTPLASTAITQAPGTGLPHDNMQPTLAANWCIAMQGIYPTRP